MSMCFQTRINYKMQTHLGLLEKDTKYNYTYMYDITEETHHKGSQIFTATLACYMYIIK